MVRVYSRAFEIIEEGGNDPLVGMEGQQERRGRARQVALLGRTDGELHPHLVPPAVVAVIVAVLLVFADVNVDFVGLAVLVVVGAHADQAPVGIVVGAFVGALSRDSPGGRGRGIFQVFLLFVFVAVCIDHIIVVGLVIVVRESGPRPEPPEGTPGGVAVVVDKVEGFGC